MLKYIANGNANWYNYAKWYGDFLEKLKIDLLYNPAIQLLEIYPDHSKSAHGRGTCTPTLIVSQFTIAKYMKPLSPLINYWIQCCMWT